MTYKDRTYCASPNCTNKCGRKMPENEKKLLESLYSKGFSMLVSYAYFCGTDKKEKKICY